jgi:transposase-like protein
MPRKSHTNEQIIYALQQVEGGKRVAEVYREVGVGEATFYAWKKLRQLRDEILQVGRGPSNTGSRRQMRVASCERHQGSAMKPHSVGALDPAHGSQATCVS